MAEFTARLDLRVSPEQRHRLEWLADHLELPPAAVVRELLDGVQAIDGVDLVATLFRLAQLEPSHFDQVKVALAPVVKRALVKSSAQGASR